MVEESVSSGKHFHEGATFKGIAAAVGLLAAAWGFVGAPTPWKVAGDATSDSLPLWNTEIIIDASAPMGAPFGDSTKLEVAATAVSRYAAADEDIGLALRTVGGGCEEASATPVGFGDGHGDDIREAVGSLRPRGRSNLTRAVREAITDFAGSEFQRQGARNQIVVFVGGDDECGEAAGREIRDELEAAGVQAIFRVFALDVSRRGQRSLAAFKRELRTVARVEVSRANDVRALEDSVRKAEEQERKEAEEAEPGVIPYSFQQGTTTGESDTTEGTTVEGTTSEGEATEPIEETTEAEEVEEEASPPPPEAGEGEAP